MKHNLLFPVFLLLFFPVEIFGQEVLSTGGGHFSNTSIQMSWTLGEPIIETIENSGTILTQGMHQPNLKITAVGELAGLDVEILAYPNPAKDFLHLRVESTKQEAFSYRLYGAGGELKTAGELSGNQATISMQGYVPASYFLKVADKENVFKTFKIIKIR